MNEIELNANALRIEIFMRWNAGELFPDLSNICFTNSSYHVSYEQTMPVIEKIIGLGFHVLMEPGRIFITGIDRNAPELGIARMVVETVDGHKFPLVYDLYEAVIQFLTWYQKPQQHLINLN